MRTAGPGRTDRRAAWLRWRWDGICPGTRRLCIPESEGGVVRPLRVPETAACGQHTDQPWHADSTSSVEALRPTAISRLWMKWVCSFL